MADEQIKPTVPASVNQASLVQEVAQTVANVPKAAQTEAAKVESSVLDLKSHISQAVAEAALSAGQAVRDEERRLKLLGAKVAGPFGRFGRAVRAAVVAFLMTLHAQS